jgi:hypothetical protein
MNSKSIVGHGGLTDEFRSSCCIGHDWKTGRGKIEGADRSDPGEPAQTFYLDARPSLGVVIHQFGVGDRYL